MREIKFRIYFEDEEPFISEPITLEDLLHGEDIEFRNEDDTLSLPLNDFRFYYKRNQNYKIMQYTGLHDKNGKEIYEGDILLRKSGSFESLILVKWGRVEFSFLCAPLYNGKLPKKFNWTRSTYQGLDGYAEVIGNIYDNPELLERSSNGD